MYKEAAGMVCVWHVTLNALQDCRAFQKHVRKVYDKAVLHWNVRLTLNDSGTAEAHEALIDLHRQTEIDRSHIRRTSDHRNTTSFPPALFSSIIR